MAENLSLETDVEDVKVSKSPRRSPEYVKGITSPVRSVHPDTFMESLTSQPDFGLRTLDFFDDDTSEEESLRAVSPGTTLHDSDLIDRGRSVPKKRNKNIPKQEKFASERNSDELPDIEGYQPLMPENEPRNDFVDTPSSSFNGSIDELLPSVLPSSPPEMPRPAYISSGRRNRQSAEVEQPPISTPSKTAGQILGAHAIAHEITLQALMRDEQALDHSLQTFAPMNPGERGSLILPPGLRVHDPRSPRYKTFSTPASKKVQVVPPPIDTTMPRRSLPAEMIRTPYPFKPEMTPRAADLAATSRPPSGNLLQIPTESILTLSVRRCNTNSRIRATTVTIPISHDYMALRLNTIAEKEQFYRGSDFDDEKFFRQLQITYCQLTGPLIFLSARSLTRIIVCGQASKAADAGYGWLHSPRSPRKERSPWKSRTDAFGEEKILQHYRKPAIGKARYAYVSWAHQIARAQDDASFEISPVVVRDEKQPEGLEFVVGWSIRRIVLAFVLVLAMSMAAALLWTLLGKSDISDAAHLHSTAGFRDAGSRVAAGVTMGICVLLIGLTGIAGWLGISWVIL